MAAKQPSRGPIDALINSAAAAPAQPTLAGAMNVDPASQVGLAVRQAASNALDRAVGNAPPLSVMAPPTTAAAAQAAGQPLWSAYAAPFLHALVTGEATPAPAPAAASTKAAPAAKTPAPTPPEVHSPAITGVNASTAKLQPFIDNYIPSVLASNPQIPVAGVRSLLGLTAAFNPVQTPQQAAGYDWLNQSINAQDQLKNAAIAASAAGATKQAATNEDNAAKVYQDRMNTEKAMAVANMLMQNLGLSNPPTMPQN